jgi:outer membrane lipoprotein-sorting protein
LRLPNTTKARRRIVALSIPLIGALGVTGCAVKKTSHLPPAAVAPPPVAASAPELVARLQKERRAVETISATVNLEPTAGSVYSGVIKQYHDVRAFVLLQCPELIRMVGQAPVVRTTIFDMASDGKEFRVWVPSKGKFIVGSTEAGVPAKNSLENLRPQHILDALIPPAADPAGEFYFLNQEREAGRIYYVLNFVTGNVGGAAEKLNLVRKVWFDASNLEVVRVEFYDAQGALVEDVHDADYQDYGGVHYPSHIELNRPVEDYSLGINVEKATFNQPIPADKFVLAKPPNSEEIRVVAAPGEVHGSGE